jgi:hypothetical protein
MSSSKSNVNSNTKMAKKSAPATDAAPTTPAPRARKAAPAAKVEVTVPVTAVEVAPVAAAPAPVMAAVSDVRSADAILTSLQEALKSLNTEVTTRVRALVADATAATKALKREARDSKRRVRKDPATMTPEERATYDARRANNAFLKLRPITPELCSFMGLPTASERSQTDVTKFVSQYVKAHNCFDPNFKRRIIPDAKLAKLLRVKDGQEVTYLNLQSFLKVHFIKTEAPKTA